MTTARLSAGTLFLHALAGGAAAAAVNVVLLLITRSAGVSFDGVYKPGDPPATLYFSAVALSSVLPALPGTGLALLLRKFAPAKAALVFTIISVAFTLFSFGGPFNIAGLSTAGVAVMEVMHVVAAIGIALPLARGLKAQ